MSHLIFFISGPNKRYSFFFFNLIFIIDITECVIDKEKQLNYNNYETTLQ